MKASEIYAQYINGLLTQKEYKDQLQTAEANYLVVDRDGTVISAHKERKQASRKVDRLDNAYGAYRYHVKVA